MQRKTSKTTYFDSVAIGKAFHHVFENRLNRKFNIPISQLQLFLCKTLNQFRFGHAVLPFGIGKEQ